MSPKLTYSKENVIKAAVNLARKNGLETVSARNVSKEMNSSIAPVYSWFDSTDELKRSVLKVANNILVEYATRQYTDKIFLNMGVGFVLFARDEDNLFRAMFLEENNFKDISQDFLDFIKYRIALDKDFENMAAAERDNLLRDMWVYVTGLATMLCSGILKESDDVFIIENLARVGAAIITSYLGKFDDPKDVNITISNKEK